MNECRPPTRQWTLSRLVVPLGWPVVVALLAPFVSDGSLVSWTILLALLGVAVVGVARYGIGPIAARHHCGHTVAVGQAYCPNCGELRGLTREYTELLVVFVPFAALYWPTLLLWPFSRYHLDVPVYGPYYPIEGFSASPALWVSVYCGFGGLLAVVVSLAVRGGVTLARY